MKVSIFWFRRDLRLTDNAGLYHALKSGQQILPIFIFDTHILSKLENKHDLRVNFIHLSLIKLKQQLKELGSDILILHGEPEEIWKKLIEDYDIEQVYTNEDYEPYAIDRDNKVKTILEQQNIGLFKYKDHCIFRYDEVLKDDGKPYTVYTPYSRKWKEKLNSFYLKSYPNEHYFKYFIKDVNFILPSLNDLGFHFEDYKFPADTATFKIIKEYKENRDFPAINGTSKLSLHFRFGTISIREKARKAKELSETWLNELIWRDFYIQIMAHFPHVVKSAFKPNYDNIEWRNDVNEYKKWCEGNTGYPIVDAGMRELNETGFMHNRVRMIVSSFLTKHLLIDWRWGEAYFAEKLLDFELASNNGGWQWAAGSGVDAAPYFRIFNPQLQTQRFDDKMEYIKKWVTEINTSKYPAPMVEHSFARNRCLEVYKKGLGGN